jgi:hypothetical protein
MVRECVALAIVALTPACSLVLDFDNVAPPIDAAIDGPFTQDECDYKEPNDSPATAVMVEATDMGPAAICPPAASGAPEDADFYKFTVMSAQVTVAIQFMNRPGGDLDIKLLDTGANMVAQSRGFGNGEMIVCPGASPACAMLTVGNDYILQVFPAVAGSVNSYTFSITP